MKTFFTFLLSSFLYFSALAQDKPVLDLPLREPSVIERSALENLKTLQFCRSLSQDDPLHFSFYSCEVIFLPKQGEVVNFMVYKPNLSENSMWQYMLTKIGSGGRIFLEEIKGIGDDGAVRNFGKISLNVK